MISRKHTIAPWLVSLLAMAVLQSGLPTIADAQKGPQERQQGDAPSYKQMVIAAIDEHILPNLDDFARKADELSEAVGKDCLPSDAKAASDVKAAFTAAVSSWARVATDRIGPARKRDRATRISFWPDPRGIVRRQMRGILANRDEALLQPAAIEKQSVAVQGLPALEILLFSSPSSEKPEERKYRCELAQAIAANVAKQAEDMKAGWMGAQGWRETMLTPGPENKIYKTEADVAAEVVKSYLTALQIIRDNQVLPWLDAVTKSKTWARLPFESAGLSQAYLANQIASLGELHRELGLDAYAKQIAAKDEKKKWIVDWLPNAYKGMAKQASQLQLPAQAAKDKSTDIKQKTRALARLKFFTNGLRQIVGREIVPATGLFLGFNELDGD